MLQQNLISGSRLGFATDVFGAGDASRRKRAWVVGLFGALIVVAWPLTKWVMREEALTSFHMTDPGPYFWGDEGPSASGDETLTPPVIDLQPVDRDVARTINAAIPFTRDALAPAPPFVLASGGEENADEALGCLTEAIYYESASEPRPGQEAVAQVVLNRVRTRGYPKSVCGVVHQGRDLRTGCQFSYNCDGSLARARGQKAWSLAESVARAALGGFVMTSVGRATHYHTDWVAPRWNVSLEKVAQIGAHIFYRWRGPAFSATPPPGASLAAMLLPSPVGPPPPTPTPTPTPRPLLTPTVELIAPVPELTRIPLPVVVAEPAKAATSAPAAAQGRRLAVPADW